MTIPLNNKETSTWESMARLVLVKVRNTFVIIYIFYLLDIPPCKLQFPESMTKVNP
jgi:hypothetical protein